MPIDVTKLFSLSYLFDVRPDTDSNLIFGLSIAFGFAILASGIVWVWFIRKEEHDHLLTQIRTRLVSWLFTTGLVGLLLVFFRFEGVPYFASRFWLFLWVVISGVWFIRLLYYLLKKFPKERRLDAERIVRERYLPKAKKPVR